jgi:hypothetical protein
LGGAAGTSESTSTHPYAQCDQGRLYTIILAISQGDQQRTMIII